MKSKAPSAELVSLLAAHDINEPGWVRCIEQAIADQRVADAAVREVSVTSPTVKVYSKVHRALGATLEAMGTITDEPRAQLARDGFRESELVTLHCLTAKLHGLTEPRSAPKPAMGRTAEPGKVMLVRICILAYQAETGRAAGRSTGSDTSEAPGKPTGPVFRLCSDVFAYAGLGSPEAAIGVVLKSSRKRKKRATPTE